MRRIVGWLVAGGFAAGITLAVAGQADSARSGRSPVRADAVVHTELARDTSGRLAPPDVNRDAADADEDADAQQAQAPIVPPVISTPDGSARAEQVAAGTKDGLTIGESFDGLGAGFTGPQGTATLRNPSDNSLAVGPDHIVQIVNSRMAIYTKKGKKYDSTGTVLYGPVATNTIFKNFSGECETRLSGDAVVRYDQLANRWLFVLPTFQRGPVRPDQLPPSRAGDPAQTSVIGRAGQPGPAAPLFVPPPPPPVDPNAPPVTPGQRGRAGQAGQTPAGPPQPQGGYSMCYAVSTSSDPLGAYYRYEFLRPLFPDYPRPAVWPDGYYIPTSTGDNRISADIATQKHACVADRVKMLAGQPATEQCVIIENVNFLNNADVDGTRLPPPGAPNIMMAAGGRQLDKMMDDHVINTWQFHVDWNDPSKTKAEGPTAIDVAPYHYMCDGQLSNCVPQPGTDRRLDSQGDKLMARLAYRNVNGHESIVAEHSINTTAGAGGVRWYEFRVDSRSRAVTLYQQGTYAPDALFRWLGSAAMDKLGDLILAYSYGGATTFPGQRATGRLANDPKGQMTMREVTMAEGAGAQTNTLRWEDYSQTAVDPTDDCRVWYVGDYLKKDAGSYSSRIGAFKMAGCK